MFLTPPPTSPLLQTPTIFQEFYDPSLILPLSPLLLTPSVQGALLVYFVPDDSSTSDILARVIMGLGALPAAIVLYAAKVLRAHPAKVLRSHPI